MNNMSISTSGPVLDSERRKKKGHKHYESCRHPRPRTSGQDTCYHDPGGILLRGLEGTGIVIFDTVLPVQLDQEKAWSGEKLLIREILLDALKLYDAGKNFPGSRHAVNLAREAFNWIMNPDEKYECSFLNICLHLGLDASAIRSRVVAGEVVFPPGGRRINHN